MASKKQRQVWGQCWARMTFFILCLPPGRGWPLQERKPGQRGRVDFLSLSVRVESEQSSLHQDLGAPGRRVATQWTPGGKSQGDPTSAHWPVMGRPQT